MKPETKKNFDYSAGIKKNKWDMMITKVVDFLENSGSGRFLLIFGMECL